MGGTGICRMVELGIEAGADVGESLIFTYSGFERIYSRRMASEIDEQHTPGIGLVEGPPQSNADPTLHDTRPQHLVATLFEGVRRCGEFVEFGSVSHISHL